MGLETIKVRLAHDELDMDAAVLDVVVQHGKHNVEKGRSGVVFGSTDSLVLGGDDLERKFALSDGVG